MKIKWVLLSATMTASSAFFTVEGQEAKDFVSPYDRSGVYAATSGASVVVEIDGARQIRLARRRQALTEMLRLREEAIAEGMKLLTEQEFYAELRERRGEDLWRSSEDS